MRYRQHSPVFLQEHICKRLWRYSIQNLPVLCFRFPPVGKVYSCRTQSWVRCRARAVGRWIGFALVPEVCNLMSLVQ
jgi:hypothetical protein